MSDIVDLIKHHREKWIAAGTWVDPDLDDCLSFMMTEVAEAIDKRLRQKPRYTCNNPDFIPLKFDIAVEVFDAIMMGVIALEILGYDLWAIGERKLEAMDSARG